MSGTSLILCHECGRLHRIEAIPAGAAARCSRCRAILSRSRPNSIERTLALTIAALFLFTVANSLPFLSLHMQGQATETTLFSGVQDLWQQGKWEVALVVLATTIVIPGLQILLLLYVLLPLRLGRLVPDLPQAFRLLLSLRPWAMMEVFLLGILVSLVKLSGMATIVAGIALWAFALLIVVLAAATAALEPHEIWDRVPWDAAAHTPPCQVPAARRQHAVGCHTCALLCTVADRAAAHAHPECPRCGATLHDRKPNSITRTWALLIAAAIFYIPANVLPVTTVTSLGHTQSDTIMSGVVYFLLHGEWPLALLIFFASVFVPLLKILVLGYLLISVQRRSQWRPAERTRLYRVTETIGRWSMVDVYVVTILVALVKLGNLATIEAGYGAVFFCAVVIVTMFAAMSFDPRLIWDRLETDHHA